MKIMCRTLVSWHWRKGRGISRVPLRKVLIDGNKWNYASIENMNVLNLRRIKPENDEDLWKTIYFDVQATAILECL